VDRNFALDYALKSLEKVLACGQAHDWPLALCAGGYERGPPDMTIARRQPLTDRHPAALRARPPADPAHKEEACLNRYIWKRTRRSRGSTSSTWAADDVADIMHQLGAFNPPWLG